VASERSSQAAHPALRGLVTPYHGYHHVDLDPGVHHGLPSRDLTVVIALDEPSDVGWMEDESSRGRHWVMTSGLHAGPALIRHRGSQHGIQFGFTPWGARVLLGMPAGAIARTMLPLAAVGWPMVDQMYDEVAGALSWEERFAVLDRLLLARAGRSEHTPMIRGELRWTWREIGRSGGRVRVDDLADALGWSRRYLSSQFGNEFGLGPKQAARVVRFQSARRSGPQGNPCRWPRWQPEVMTTGSAPAPNVWHSLSYDDARAGIEFLNSAFGFITVAVYTQDDDPTKVVHAELSWPPGGGVMLGSAPRPDGWPDIRGRGPAYCVVESGADVDCLYKRAVAAGAKVLREPTGEDHAGRDCVLLDPEGNQWSFGSYRGQPFS
jgi:uncharacterized glyoxalase superfamily protein PhnB/AraC-like DNA-binding protein